jgi:hypothetical protein
MTAITQQQAAFDAGNGTAPPSRQIGRREPALFEDE